MHCSQNICNKSTQLYHGKRFDAMAATTMAIFRTTLIYKNRDALRRFNIG